MKPEKEEGAFTGARRIPWAGPRGLDAVLQGWRTDRQLWPSFVLDEVAPAREGVYADLPEDVAPAVRAALQRRGIDKLFSHQDNVGPAAVERWQKALPQADIDEWVEHIAFEETRDYVKSVAG